MPSTDQARANQIITTYLINEIFSHAKAWLFFMKHLLYLSLFIFITCKTESADTPPQLNSYVKISGQTMGTSYNIQCDLNDPDLKAELDSLLVEINDQVSTYEPESVISKVNKNNLNATITSEGVVSLYGPAKKHFQSNFLRAKSIYIQTNGYFDPTVMPLVNHWGFGYTPKEKVTQVDSARITEILKLIGFNKWQYKKDKLNAEIIKPQHAEIDFSAIAKGYAVDYLSSFLEQRGANNLMVEIGGEVYTKGTNSKGLNWTIGLNKPEEDAALNDFALLVQISDKALASSGNYRNFYISNGKKFAHEINPKTGFPEFNDLLGRICNCR